MRIGSNTDNAELVVLERAPPGLPNEGDLRVRVNVTLGAFFGTYDAVWLERTVLVEFVDRLVSLERTRSGEALLRSVSPDEFVLRLRARGSAGHLVADIVLQRYQYSGVTRWPTRISGGFELEPSQLPEVLGGFRALVEG